MNWDTAPVQKYTTTANTTFTFSSPTNGGVYVLLVVQGAAHTLTWPAAVKWPSSVTPTFTATANKLDVFTFIYDGTYYYGSYVQNFL